jgi:glycosyltransferase involved in cell wall biosynthesis
MAALMEVLYVSYDGALDPLGQSQVLPYIEGLSGRGYRFSLLTFEKPERFADAPARRALEERLARSGVRWHPLPYTKRPPLLSTAFDLARGAREARRIASERGLRLVHARSYPSSLIAQSVARRQGIPWIFDMRGFYPEERTDGGLWRENGAVYKVAKRLEAGFLRDAGAVVTLTEASLPPLRALMRDVGARTPVHVIPTCVDEARFPLLPPAPAPFTLAYSGSIGTWYLLDEMMALGRAVLERADRAGAGGESRLLFVVNQEQERVRAAAAKAGVADRLEIRSVAHDRVPQALAAASATFFLIRPGGSKIASAATKFGESLALGRPVLANRGVGDTAAVIERDRVGVVVERFGPDEYARAADALLGLVSDPGTAARCRASAEARYALAHGVDAYADIYRALAGSPT